MPNTILLGNTEIKSGSVIGPNSYIKDSKIGSNTMLNNTQCYDSQIGNNVSSGPFVHIRPNCKINDNVHIGNFVEVKNSIVDEGSKLPHLLYVGDSDVGKDVNFGCGCVTVNYDGRNKSRTIVKDGAFIGCNTNLVAPVTIGENAFTAAGSTITENVPDNALSVARAKQTNKENWVNVKKPYKRQHQELK
jgi:bifunctional UDP-N-acetylglucosamine pyrophosphorylase/glucosamine-1-phosphate N-acetyltransferase